MKSLEDIHRIAVIGAGTMGQGIAQVAAQAGHEVLLYDVSADMLALAQKLIDKNLTKAVELGKLRAEEKEASLQRIRVAHDLTSLQVDLVIEAIVEKLEVKQKLFASLEAINSPETIFASNTSSIPITQIAAGLKHPERVVGMHFFNPAHIMKLVEVISGADTHKSVAQLVADLSLKWGKKPVFAQDAPGFIVNRVARHYYVESLKLVEENVTDFATVDRLLESSGFKMGPFRLMDLIGVDTNFSVTSSMFASFHYEAKFRPSRIQQQKVDAGHHGRKTGKGFYTYEK
ncbi:3-hydroxyacyl-CoA dehydrogenase NAD-binding domain-containing protein [Cytophagales bacterium LB-30]|uniref:3-hydroxyacyl-CoA dehydrogenase NAD-binding domain-containing protein n=1 Tax=Shiella aurantiaca TaxID=3058365 RepID=A0ABT8F2F4_9BACT|nr:3-hydroxyacyl-CoA dehydrogenase NAD-binding domain-containing protein [Shiella aurantiaca]MDN4164638.1 3-hydroxyacyl-CoA dehydrogenase NAD-binding domain-containing protein [Shiella aurantiaca]